MISATANSTTLRVLENGRLQVDLVRPDAERPDRPQVRGLREDFGGHARARAQAEHLNAIEPRDQLLVVERAVHLLDDDAGRGQQVGRSRVNALDQQSPDRARGRRSSHARAPYIRCTQVSARFTTAPSPGEDGTPSAQVEGEVDESVPLSRCDNAAPKCVVFLFSC
jgi:hypothetical protein